MEDKERSCAFVKVWSWHMPGETKDTHETSIRVSSHLADIWAQNLLNTY